MIVFIAKFVLGSLEGTMVVPLLLVLKFHQNSKIDLVSLTYKSILVFTFLPSVVFYRIL